MYMYRYTDVSVGVGIPMYRIGISMHCIGISMYCIGVTMYQIIVIPILVHRYTDDLIHLYIDTIHRYTDIMYRNTDTMHRYNTHTLEDIGITIHTHRYNDVYLSLGRRFYRYTDDNYIMIPIYESSVYL
jgi:hypothetical protein